jgi:hypothetical protein
MYLKILKIKLAAEFEFNMTAKLMFFFSIFLKAIFFLTREKFEMAAEFKMK